MVKLQDIADEFDISVSTVSRILNGKGRVKDELRQKVLDYAKSVHYTPNLIAKSLKYKESKAIGLVVPDITNIFYGLIFSSIEKYARQLGYSTMLFNCGSDKHNNDEFASQLQNSYLDGMVVATNGSDVWAQIDQRLLDKVVFIDNRPQTNHREIDFIGCDYMYSAYKLTKFILEKKYDKIMVITGPSNTSSASERLQGFKNAMLESNFEIKENYIIKTDFTYDDACSKLHKQFSAGNVPGAIIAQNNVTAYAALSVAKEFGLKVPDDLGIACFDHIDIYGFMEPKFTNMMQPVKEIGIMSAKLLLDKLNSEKTLAKGTQHITLKHEFIRGETV